MLVVRTLQCRADPLGQLVGTEHTRGLDHLALAVNPFGFVRVEPRALLGQQTSDDPHSTTTLFDFSVMRTYLKRLTSRLMCQSWRCPRSTPTLFCRALRASGSTTPKSAWLSRLPDAHPRNAAMSFRARACTVRSKRWPSDRGRLFRPSAQPDAAAHPLR